MADPNFRLKKGTFIDQQVGFVDAFNYVYENVNGIEGGQGIDLDKSLDGAWKINATANDGGGEGGGGGGIDEAVYDVAAATQGGHDGIEVTYADNRSPTFIQFPSPPLSVDAVEDITRAAGGGDGDELSVTYTNGNASTVPLYTTLTGTDNTSDKDTEFKFASASDSNVVVTISDKRITLGVYYL